MLAVIASARSGTSRCGITLVYQEPGPKISQSASATAASTGLARRRGRRGQPQPLDLAIGDRHLVLARAPRPASRPAARHRASILSGTGAIGSTRPRARTSSPPGPAPPPDRRYSSISPHSSRLPTGCPASASDAGEPVLQQRGGVGTHGIGVGQRGQRLAQVARRQAPRSARSRPLEPPSSATVTTAVIPAPATARSARNEADSPWPPPKATDGLTRAPGPGAGRWPTRRRSAQPAGQLLGDGDAAVLAAGAADGDGEVALALPLEPGRGGVDQPGVGLHEGGRPALAQHVPAHPVLQAGVLAQLRHPVRVGQEARVQHEVGVRRQAVLEAEGEHGDPQPAARPPRRTAPRSGRAAG